MTTLQNPRELRGLGIISQGGDAIVKVSETAYSVKSQSNGGRYAVTVGRTGNWYCECPDFTTRNVNCKHIFAVLFSRKLAAQAEWDARQEAPAPSPSPVGKPAGCPFCGASRVLRDGVRQTGRGAVQRFECGACRRKFTP
ncbi:MAG: SWIM zinc finger family protein, partial [Halobacteria archaeon]